MNSDIDAGLPSGADWSAEELRRVGYAVVDRIAEYLTQLPDRPVFRPVPADLAEKMLSAPAPRSGISADALLEDFGRTIAAYPFGNGHPRFYGWVNSPPTPIGIFADALAATMNPSVAGGNHAAVYVERQVINWLKELFGFPASSMGLLTSGGSAAALTALGVARWRACQRRGWDVRARGVPTGTGGTPGPLVFYKAPEGHGCHQKAIELLGVGSDQVRFVATDADLRLRPDALAAMLDEDVAAGRIPVAVIASAGTVNTGAIDPLDAIADVCARHDVWLHLDGAYGAPAVLTDEYGPALRAMARADSLTVDPHKWLYVPVEAGAVLVRDAAAMRGAFSLVPPYLRTDGDEHGVQGPPWLSEFGFQQTRGFRALKVSMALRHHGLDGYRRLVSHDIALARHLADRVRNAPDLELWEPQHLSIVCFRYVGTGEALDGTALDTLNRRLLEHLQLGGEAFLSSTTLDGHFWLRACIVNPRARTTDLDAVVELVQRLGARS